MSARHYTESELQRRLVAARREERERLADGDATPPETTRSIEVENVLTLAEMWGSSITLTASQARVLLTTLRVGSAPETANPGGTHYEGCWRTRGHHLCAIAEVERTEARLALANAEIRALRKSR